MNPIAEELNQIIENDNPKILEMLSDVGKNLFFPKGILSQSAEAKEKAHRLNATIGIATEKGRTMRFDSIMESIAGILPEGSLTYAPSFGLLSLRKRWQDELSEKNPSLSGKRISLPVVTSGITHGISILGDVWVDPGDVIIVPDMMWGNYNLILNVRRGAALKHYPLFSESSGFNLTAFEECVESEAKNHSKIIVLLNFPHNPTGYAITETEGDRIADVLTKIAESGTNVVAVCDDAYFGLFYEAEVQKESVFAKLCGRHSRLLAIKLDGATKENYVWGLRVGFITYGTQSAGDPLPLYEALEKKTAGDIRGNISNASHLSQSIILRSMENDNYRVEKAEKYDILKKRAERVKTVLSDPKYGKAWEVYPFNSGYFMCIRLKTVDAEALRSHILDTYGVGLISIGQTDLRVAFSCLEEDDIQELFDIVLKGVEDLETR